MANWTILSIENIKFTDNEGTEHIIPTKPVYTYKGNVYVSEKERDKAVKNDKNILKINNENPLLCKRS